MVDETPKAEEEVQQTEEQVEETQEEAQPEEAQEDNTEEETTEEEEAQVDSEDAGKETEGSDDEDSTEEESSEAEAEETTSVETSADIQEDDEEESSSSSSDNPNTEDLKRDSIVTISQSLSGCSKTQKSLCIKDNNACVEWAGSKDGKVRYFCEHSAFVDNSKTEEFHKALDVNKNLTEEVWDMEREIELLQAKIKELTKDDKTKDTKVE